MKHTHHQDPFEYSSYQSDPIFDFNLKQDWMLVAGVAGMIAICGVIYLVSF